MVLVLLSIPILILSLTSCTPSKRAENKIIIWHWMNDRKDAFRELAEKYQAESGIDVEFKLFSPPDIYGQKVIAAASGYIRDSGREENSSFVHQSRPHPGFNSGYAGRGPGLGNKLLPSGFGCEPF